MISTRLPLAASTAALFLLAGCSEPEPTVVGGATRDPMATDLANAAPVELPPAIRESHSYRCQPGNSVVFIDFFADDLGANFRTSRDEPPVRLTSATAGGPFVADGYSVSGSGSTVNVDTPDSDPRECSR